MNAKEVRDLTGKERLEKMDDLSQEYFNLKFQLATGKMEVGDWKFINFRFSGFGRPEAATALLSKSPIDQMSTERCPMWILQ